MPVLPRRRMLLSIPVQGPPADCKSPSQSPGENTGAGWSEAQASLLLLEELQVKVFATSIPVSPSPLSNHSAVSSIQVIRRLVARR